LYFDYLTHFNRISSTNYHTLSFKSSLANDITTVDGVRAEIEHYDNLYSPVWYSQEKCGTIVGLTVTDNNKVGCTQYNSIKYFF